MMAVSKAPLEFGHFQGNILGSSSEIAAVVAATVTLALFVAFILSRLGLQQFVELSSTLSRKSSLSSLLITAAFSCTIFSDMVCCLFSNG